MKRLLLMPPTVAAFLLIAAVGTDAAQPPLAIETGVELRWATTLGNSYQPQSSPNLSPSFL